MANLDDARIRYFRVTQGGAAAARNFGNRKARGRYIVIMDDDDMMVSTRLEDHLKALEDSHFHGSYGGWINFKDSTWQVVGKHPRKTHSLGAMFSAGRVVVHAGMMIEARLFDSFQYDESRSAGIDFGLVFQLTFHGLRLKHTGTYALLRRLHSTNMTAVQSAQQKESAQLAVQAIVAHLSEDEKADLRRRGKAAEELPCNNLDTALAELAEYQRGLVVRRHDLRFTKKPPRGASEFDPHIYQERYPDVRLSGLSPAEHYRLVGQLLGRSGSK